LFGFHLNHSELMRVQMWRFAAKLKREKPGYFFGGFRPVSGRSSLSGFSLF
jgi:hypothetical protein